MSDDAYEKFRSALALCPQETKTYADGAYATDVDLDGETPSSGLISLGMMPTKLRNCIGGLGRNVLPPVRPIVAAFSYARLTGPAHTVQVALIGRKVAPDAGAVEVRSTILIAQDGPISGVFAFNMPVPMDTEAGWNPFSIRIRTVGKVGRSIATVNYQWGLLDLSSDVAVGVSG